MSRYQGTFISDTIKLIIDLTSRSPCPTRRAIPNQKAVHHSRIQFMKDKPKSTCLALTIYHSVATSIQYDGLTTKDYISIPLAYVETSSVEVRDC